MRQQACLSTEPAQQQQKWVMPLVLAVLTGDVWCTAAAELGGLIPPVSGVLPDRRPVIHVGIGMLASS